ncbi:helix-turn-helix domain-containing protein [Herbihabitans rhizosphaerae]|uniref:helix-turn-helix domain-containing protein n=1 Tax=Herbihabitans rhizosphaerae TaxID=1872711 RepID=UPI001F5ED29F|nr:helix-turn-helix transcriptional regulator [Herbihabitans rhizosphaerae]
MTDDHLARVVGDRIRFYRTAARRTKTVVAGLVGITPDYLYQIERGQKVPTIEVLTRLAEVLRVAPGDLLNDPPAVPRPRGTGAPSEALFQALTAPPPAPAPANSTAPHVGDLRREVASAWHTWQTSPHRYSRLTAELPGLIASTETALRLSPGIEQREAHRTAADLYCLLRTVTKRVGRGDLSLLVADRGLQAAETADDPIRLAAARWNLAQVLLADGQADAAEAVALHARTDVHHLVEAGNADAMAVSGSLLLISAIAAVRGGDVWTARDRLREAVPLADRVGERNTCWTAFGPTNVAMYAVSVEVESGEAVEGLRLAGTINQDRSPSIERRVAFLLDQAKGYGQRRDFPSALQILKAAEQDAPEDVRYRPAAHAVLRAVIERGRRSVSADAVRLATRVGMPA